MEENIENLDIEEIVDFPIQNTFNEDDMSQIENEEEKNNVSNENN